VRSAEAALEAARNRLRILGKNPLPLPVWDRQRGKLVKEWMEDHQPHYESEPQRSLTQWIKSRPLYDRLYALYENSR
jgi:phosphatidylserine decarboxylase